MTTAWPRSIHQRGNGSIFLYAFDLIELNGDDMRRDPLEVRKATLAYRGQGQPRHPVQRTYRGRRPDRLRPRLQDGTRRHRVEAEGLDVSLGALAGLAHADNQAESVPETRSCLIFPIARRRVAAAATSKHIVWTAIYGLCFGTVLFIAISFCPTLLRPPASRPVHPSSSSWQRDRCSHGAHRTHAPAGRGASRRV
jgi:hypothetical protein